MPQLALYLLGPPRIEHNGKPVEVDTRKAVALLVYLVLMGGRHGRDSLANLLWPDYTQTSARAALRRTLSALRKALQSDYLEVTWETIGLLPGIDLWSDIAQFRRLISECSASTQESERISTACLHHLEEAARLYRGDFLAGFTLRDSPNFDEWQFFESENLRRELAAALEKLAVGLGSQGEYERAISYTRRWLALDHLSEAAHRQLMLLFAWNEQRSAALRQYRECVRILEQELGVPPLEGTTHLYQAILEGQAPSPPVKAGFSTESVSKRADQAEESQNIHEPLLVGRSRQWDSLLQAYQRQGRHGFFAVLEGEPGIGKTRLAEEFLSSTRKQGAITITARCYQGETSLAYGPFIEALQTIVGQPALAERLPEVPSHWRWEAARLLPEVGGHDSKEPPAFTPIEGPGAQSRFFEGLRQVFFKVLAGETPGVFFLDDLHWADTASLDLLTYLVRRVRAVPVFFLASWRSQSTSPGPRLHQLISEVQRQGNGLLLPLARLSRAEIEELTFKLSPPARTLPKDFFDHLYRETEGLPFFAVEYLENIFKTGSYRAGDEWEIPGNVRDLLLSRLAGVGEMARQILSTAAVIGRSFDINTLREASGRSEPETVAGLENILDLDLVEERKSGENSIEITYDFTHEKIRSLVYEETSQVRRRLLHRRVAEALASQARSRREASLLDSQIAQHYRLAGREDLAAEFFKSAGEQARSLYANIEAAAHFEAALAAGHPDTARLHEALGDLRTLQGEYNAALVCYEKAAALCPPENLARLEHKLGYVHHRRGDWDLAVGHFQAAIELLEEKSEPGLLAALYADWSRTAHHQGRTSQAVELARQAIDLARSVGDTPALGQAHNILGILARNSGGWDQASFHLHQSLDIARTLSDPSAQVAALNNLALCYGDSSHYEQAIAYALEALDLCKKVGDRHREAALHNNLADLHYSCGNSEEAMEHLKKAVVIFSEIGIEAGSMQPEIWKLTEW